MARGPDAQPRRRAKHNDPHAPGSQVLERRDDAAGHLGAEGVARALVVKGDDANLPVDIRPDGAVRAASSPGRVATPLGHRGLPAQRTAALARQDHVGSRHRVPARPEDGAHQPLRLDPLVAREGVDDMAPEHLLQDAEFSLDLGNVETGRETVRRDLAG